MWIGDLMLSLLNLPMIGLGVSLLKVPYRLLFRASIVFSAIGIYSTNTSSFEICLTAFFGILDFVGMKLRCSPVPVMLGFVLGPMMEESLRRAILISRSDPTVFLTHPIGLACVIATVLILVVIPAPTVRNRWGEITS
jgi:putative tricarboxylic transport membrane protein